MMTTEERKTIEARIEELENNIFRIEMIDRWDSECYVLVRKWKREERELKQKLNEI